MLVGRIAMTLTAHWALGNVCHTICELTDDPVSTSQVILPQFTSEQTGNKNKNNVLVNIYERGGVKKLPI